MGCLNRPFITDPRGQVTPAASSLRLARELRRAYDRREKALAAHITAYDKAVTREQRYEAGGSLLVALHIADAAYMAARNQAILRFSGVDEEALDGQGEGA